MNQRAGLVLLFGVGTDECPPSRRKVFTLGIAPSTSLTTEEDAGLALAIDLGLDAQVIVELLPEVDIQAIAEQVAQRPAARHGAVLYNPGAALEVGRSLPAGQVLVVEELDPAGF